MNTISKPAVLSAIQSARVQEITDEAYNGYEASFYIKNGRYPTEAEKEAFITAITPKLIASVLKAVPTEDLKAQRQARIAAVEAAAKAKGVKFLHVRQIDQYETLVSSEKLGRNLSEETILVHDTNATLGGETIAFKYVITPEGDLNISYAVAFCRHDENFDPLIGMEEALTKFNAGKLSSAAIVHERLGLVKLGQLTRAAKLAYENVTQPAVG